MKERLSEKNIAPPGLKALLQLSGAVAQSGIEESLQHLVYLRSSQLNGCAYCTDMHWKDARAAGATEQQAAFAGYLLA